MSFTGKTKASTYKDILQMNNSNNGVDGTLRNVVDGEGTVSSIYVSDDEFKVKPVTNGTNTFSVESGLSEDLLLVDTTNKVVKTGLGQQYANTGYLEYGCDGAYSSGFSAGTHFAIPANGSHGYAIAPTVPNFGTAADPELTRTFTTGASNLSKMWHFLPDTIIIDQVYIWIGNEDNASDVVRFHLISYAIETSSSLSTNEVSIKQRNNAMALSNNFSFTIRSSGKQGFSFNIRTRYSELRCGSELQNQISFKIGNKLWQH